jgi:hypothetical protein
MSVMHVDQSRRIGLSAHSYLFYHLMPECSDFKSEMNGIQLDFPRLEKPPSPLSPPYGEENPKEVFK